MVSTGLRPTMVVPSTVTVAPSSVTTTTPPGWRLVSLATHGSWGTWATVTVLGTTIVGRSPVDTTGTHYLLGIPDISRSISRSHALLEIDGPLLWVTDLGSVNGSAVALPGGAFSPLTPYVRSPAPAGARIALGTRTLQVADPTRPEGAQ